jgi:predicted glycoside hydrolase/deacetylase ChbG (UPF0249 family)
MMRDFWREQGLADRVVLIIHHDDLGLTQAQNQAHIDLGFPSGSVMVAADYADQVQGADIGVHLTLTSEWDALRLKPLTNGRSLRDSAGYFWKTLPEAWMHIDPLEAELEMRAQIERAISLGLDITHLDSHMGTLFYPSLAKIYLQLGLEYHLPIALPQNLDEWLSAYPSLLKAVRPLLMKSPLPKVKVMDGYSTPNGLRRGWFLQTLAKLQPGVYHFIHHAAVPSTESQRIPDWQNREADLEALQDATVRRAIANFTQLTYREIRDALRTSM